MSIKIAKIIEQLNEAKNVGLLYHFTSYKGAIGIIEDGYVLKPGIYNNNISFTRNKNMKSDTVSQNVRFTIDGTGLSNVYKLQPYTDLKSGYGRHTTDESEEIIDASKYPNGVKIGKYVLEILINKPSYRLTMSYDDEEEMEPPQLIYYKELLELLNKNSIPYKLNK